MSRLKLLTFIRLLQIYAVIMRHGLNRVVLSKESRFLRLLSYLNPFSFCKQTRTRGESMRLVLESLGPIFVKFGQILSTRHDLLPSDILIELAKLQDQVPPFKGKIARHIIEKAFKQPIEQIYAEFDEKPLASASIAQVHAATLFDGKKVIVKILRPHITTTIRQDINLLFLVAKLAEVLWKEGKRLRLVEVVCEFEQTIIDELDLMREAANASTLRRNFMNSDLLYVPAVYWEYTKKGIMTMERIHGVRISDVETLKRHGTNLKKLAEHGVEIFFTQVFRDSFFHADMHPGNLFVDIHDPNNPKYLGVDFGIMGSLNPNDHHYLAQNILAFFRQDYRRVAMLHVESGWVPPDTRVDQFEAAIRTVCEPIFQRPLSGISFGQLLLKLFQTAKRFDMEVQPQLVLLQKTLFNIEGLGRRLYPELDLWTTAKPFMMNYIRKRQGIKSLAKYAHNHWHTIAEDVLKTPELAYNVLHHIQEQQRYQQYYTVKPNPSQNRGFILGVGATLITTLTIYLLTHTTHSDWSWFGLILGALLLMVGWRMSD